MDDTAAAVHVYSSLEIAAATFVLVLCMVVVVVFGFLLNKQTGWQAKAYHWRIFMVVSFYAVGVMFGMMGQHSNGPWSFGLSLYFTTVTVTTVGYGDEYPVSKGGKIFMIFFIFIGLAIVADALSVFVDFVLAKQEAIFKQMLVAANEEKKRTVESNLHRSEKEVEEEITSRMFDDMTKRHKKQFMRASSEILLLVLVGTVFYGLNEPGFDWVDAAYWSTCTISTVGYGDLNLQKDSSKYFTIFYICFSFSVVARNLSVFSQIALDRSSFKKRQELMNKPLSAEAILDMDKDRDGSVTSGEFLAAMLVAENLIDEDVCNLYLDKFRRVDKTNDGKLNEDDLVELANQESIPSSNAQTPAAHNPLQTMSPAEEFPVTIPETFSTSAPGRESYVASAEQEKVDDAIIGHAKQGGNLQHVMQSDRLAKIQAVFRAMDEDMSGEITTDEMLDFAKIYKGNPNFSRRRCQNLLNKIDTSRNGMINEAEFVAFFAGLTNSITDEEIFNRGIQKYMDAAQELTRRSQQKFQNG